MTKVRVEELGEKEARNSRQEMAGERRPERRWRRAPDEEENRWYYPTPITFPLVWKLKPRDVT